MAGVRRTGPSGWRCAASPPSAFLSPAQAAGDRAGRRPAVPSFRHVVVVVFENHERSEIVGSSSAPTYTALAPSWKRRSLVYDAV